MFFSPITGFFWRTWRVNEIMYGGCKTCLQILTHSPLRYGLCSLPWIWVSLWATVKMSYITSEVRSQKAVQLHSCSWNTEQPCKTLKAASWRDINCRSSTNKMKGTWMRILLYKLSLPASTFTVPKHSASTSHSSLPNWGSRHGEAGARRCSIQIPDPPQNSWTW